LQITDCDQSELVNDCCRDQISRFAINSPLLGLG
jgi:hypothetical protein